MPVNNGGYVPHKDWLVRGCHECGKRCLRCCTECEVPVCFFCAQNRYKQSGLDAYYWRCADCHLETND